ncbi:tetratricopeptide repeat protein 19, mitochondrial [Patella vulgata]|uniref:tetratricopeptide repeat protein 19, mitochondrial n=1 Tax=Patella vulgata TaxID=6465 RepID=UPI0021807EC2|nr:tetratricopeptide repeat protein 19, mitochondrial [Patella vulgata]
MARLAQMKQDEEKAITYLHKALTAADDEFKHNRMSEKDYIYARINVFDSLANIALAKGEYTKAEKLFKETMKGCLEVGITKTDNAMVEMSIKLASIYAMQKREDEAVRGYEFCIETQDLKVKDPECDIDSLALLGIALESYGRYLLYHKNLEQSLVMLTRAVEVAKTTLGESGMQTLVLMNDLATVYILKKDFEKAEALLKQAIETGEKVESTHCPALYCNLGAVYLRKSQLSDTELACKHGLQLAKKYTDKLAIEQAKICLKKVKEMKNKGF